MADKIDMSLDEIIKTNRKSQPQRRTGGAGGAGGGNVNTRPNAQRQNRQNNVALRNGTGPMKAGNFNRQNRRQSGPYTRPAPVNHATNDRWPHDKFDRPNRVGKLSISNLHYRVTDQDLRELFNEFGGIKSAHVFYDKSGRSLGTAQVVFNTFASASAAKKRYHGVMLDGRNMIISLEGEIKESVISENRLKKPRLVQNSNNNQGQQTRGPRNNQNRNAGRNKTAEVAKPKAQTPKQKRPAKPTQAELDADLDAYISKQN